MRTLILVALLFVYGFSYSQIIPVIKIGDKLPLESEKMLNATDEKQYDFKAIKNENGILVIFSCNTCPFIVAWEDRYPIINELAKKNNVGFALVNSNYMKRGDDDSWDKMKEHASTLKYKWPYLLDNESKVANAFGAQTTPHVFLFDKNNKLVYKGTIDDNYKNADQVKDFYLKDALENLGKGKEITNKETRNIGCSIKRKIVD
jgi:thioredoxin-related protein